MAAAGDDGEMGLDWARTRHGRQRLRRELCPVVPERCIICESPGLILRPSKPGAISDKRIVHGSGFRGLNYNLFDLSRRLHPHLAVIDGYDGMEGNGPTRGTLVEHRVCVASPDWLAADRVALELMGIDFAKVGYLNYCAQAGLGEGELQKIEVVGEPIAKHIRRYKLADKIAQQLVWMAPPKPS
jgi:Domain of unknown function (DUF362)